MTSQEIVERLKLIQPGLENSNSSAEQAMVDLLPDVIAALTPRTISAGQITSVGPHKGAKACSDCIDDWCQMNCGPAA
jgi:hypothetical protein